jgi:hypothetical protein
MPLHLIILQPIQSCAACRGPDAWRAAQDATAQRVDIAEDIKRLLVLKSRAMSEQVPGTSETKGHEPSRESGRVLHRVCIQCNKMFRVTPENFEAKQCANCHKG